MDGEGFGVGGMGLVDNLQNSFNQTLNKVGFNRPSNVNKKQKKITRSMQVYEVEFAPVFERKEYSSKKVD